MGLNEKDLEETVKGSKKYTVLKQDFQRLFLKFQCIILILR